MHPKIKEWEKQREVQLLMGGKTRIEKQHAAGKLTVRERVDYLLDPGSFQEVGMFVKSRNSSPREHIPGDALVCGYGTVNGRPIYVFGSDPTVKGGSFAENTIKKMNWIMKKAIEAGVPVVTLNEAGGGRLTEGCNNSNMSEIFYYNVLGSGWIPQISAIMGPCAGGTVYSPALTDFVYMVEGKSNMFLTGPSVIKQVTGETIDKEGLGGAAVHSRKSGTCHFVAKDDYDCIDQIKYLLSFLPQNSGEQPPIYECTDDPNRLCPELDDIIPENPRQPYDVKKVIEAIVDNGEYIEPFANWASNVVIALGRMNGKTVGFFANQPMVKAGCLDLDGSDKAARFIRFCDAFNIPVVYLADIPGYLPGVEQEHGGIIRHGAKLVFANAEATVPKIVVVLKKFYGGGKAGMCCTGLHCDLNFFWPTGQSAIMGAEGAVSVLYKKQLEAAPPEEREALRAQYIEEFSKGSESPMAIMENMYADEIIRPSDTRKVLCQALELLANKKDIIHVKKKHAIMPV